MFDDSIYPTLSYATDLRTLNDWTQAWYDQAIAADFIHPPYHPDTDTIDRVRGYFNAGLSPAEAAQACFGHKH